MADEAVGVRHDSGKKDIGIFLRAGVDPTSA